MKQYKGGGKARRGGGGASLRAGVQGKVDLFVLHVPPLRWPDNISPYSLVNHTFTQT